MTIYQTPVQLQALALIKGAFAEVPYFSIDENGNVRMYDEEDVIRFHVLFLGEYFATIDVRDTFGVTRMTQFTPEGVEIYWNEFDIETPEDFVKIIKTQYLPFLLDSRRVKEHKKYDDELHGLRAELTQYEERVEKLKEVVPHIEADNLTFLTLLHSHFLYSDGEGYAKAKSHFEKLI